jgi:hypothetical protein
LASGEVAILVDIDSLLEHIAADAGHGAADQLTIQNRDGQL